MGQRPVQIQVDEEVWRVLKVFAASKDVSANEIVARLATEEAERVRDKVSAVLDA